MKENLLQILKQLKEQPAHLDMGICGNVRELSPDTEAWVVNGKLLRSLLGKWPDKAENHHHDHYPVEGSCVEYLIDSQQAILWRNPRRIALLDWLIKELEE